LVYTLTIAFLMVSRLPFYSGKRLGNRVPPDLVLLVFVGVVLLVALLISYPWEVLTISTLLYLASAPFAYLTYREYARRDARAVATTKVDAVSVDAGKVDAPDVGAATEAARPSSVVPFDSGADARERQTRR
jgi:CDP-diacylglycerol--serine O-phosphatidyltransferase